MPYYPLPFSAAHGLKTSRLYYARDYYKTETARLFRDAASASPSKNPNYVDVWNERPFYGKVNTVGTLVMPNEDFLLYGADTGNLVAQQWVYNAAIDFRSYMNRALLHGKTNLSKLFGDFRIKKSYVSIISEYLTHAYTIMSKFNENIISSKWGAISTFEEYLALFLAHLTTLEDPFSFSNYYASSRTSINATGMAIQFKTLNADNDSLKNDYFTTNQFAQYVQAAANFGFRINQNVPWMLIADINSAPMKKYLLQESIGDPTALFTQRYRSVFELDAMIMPDVIQASFEDYQSRYKFQFATKFCLRPDPSFKRAISSQITRQQQIKLPIKPMSEWDFEVKYSQNRAILLQLVEAVRRADNNKLNQQHYKRFYARFMAFLQRGDNPAATRALETFYNPFKNPPK